MLFPPLRLSSCGGLFLNHGWTRRSTDIFVLVVGKISAIFLVVIPLNGVNLCLKTQNYGLAC